MKLQQLRYIWEVAHNDLNVSATAQSLFTSQPGISKQIRLLEDELGIEVFARSGKHLTHITPAGEAILQVAGNILGQVENIKNIAREFNDEARGDLSIATTHTQARYVLPSVMRRFMGRFPEVSLHMQQGNPAQIAEMASDGTVDFAIATESLDKYTDLVVVPCYRWNRMIVVPHDHPILSEPQLSLAVLAKYPLVTYVKGFTGRSKLDDAFASAGLQPNIVLTASDADVIKTYVKLGMGVGIVASMAYDSTKDADLSALSADALFEPSTTYIAFRKGIFLRGFMYEFMQQLATHLQPELIEELVRAHRLKQDCSPLLENISLPFY